MNTHLGQREESHCGSSFFTIFALGMRKSYHILYLLLACSLIACSPREVRTTQAVVRTADSGQIFILRGDKIYTIQGQKVN